MTDANLVIPEVIGMHAEEAATLSELRQGVLDARHLRLKDLRRVFDDRIAAHLDGLAVAGEYAFECSMAKLAEPSAGAVFTAGVLALDHRRHELLEKLFAVVGAVPQSRVGLVAAFGFVERDRLHGIGTALLGSTDPLKRGVGVAACSIHRVDPGLASGPWLWGDGASIRAMAIKAAAEIGCLDAIPACSEAVNAADPECQFWAAWSTVLLGGRGRALNHLTDAAVIDGEHRRIAFRLALQAMGATSAHQFLERLSQDPAERRWLIEGSGIAGDPRYLPWLIKHMADEKTARVAAYSFSLVTGLDMTGENLDRSRPPDFVSGPSDNPEDKNVEDDPDQGLPWPDVAKIERWWEVNSGRFQKGTRYFIGAPVTREHCIDVLKNGYQRQRILAAQYLCLLEPGTPLFNTSAPAWRQQRLLAKMT